MTTTNMSAPAYAAEAARSLTPIGGLSARLDHMVLNRRHWMIFLLCSGGMMAESIDLQIMSFAAPHILEDWHLTSQQLGGVISAAMVGMILGTYTLAMLADVMGRRLIMQYCVGIFAIFTGLAGLAAGAVSLLLLRAIAGFGLGASIPVNTAMLIEFLPTAARGRLLPLYAIFFSLGGFVAAATATVLLPSFGWRSLFVIGLVPGILVFLLMLVPESPRFLIGQKRFDEAERATAWLETGSPAWRQKGSGPAHVRGPQTRLALSRFTGLFTREHLRSTIVTWTAWGGWSFAYYGLVLWLPTLINHYQKIPQAQMLTFMMGYTAVGMVGRLAMTPLVGSLGRKPVIIGCAIASAIAILFLGLQTTLPGLIAFGYLVAFFGDGGWSGIVPYTPESFPTSMRSTAAGWATGFGRAASAVAPVVVGSVVSTAFYSAFVMFAIAMLLVAVVTAALGKETRGIALD